MNADQHGDRLFWLLLIGLGIVWITCRFPRFSLAVIAALGITTALYKLGVV